MKRGFCPLMMLACLLPLSGFGQAVVINEIMYHPSSENILEEYVELHNPAATNAVISGWSLSSGFAFTFPANTTIPAGGYLVVAANTNTFRAKYPGIANVVGNWTGLLNNSSEAIELVNPNGDTIDRLTYADEGDWGMRQRGPLE